jgi:hypothetical protein
VGLLEAAPLPPPDGSEPPPAPLPPVAPLEPPVAPLELEGASVEEVPPAELAAGVVLSLLAPPGCSPELLDGSSAPAVPLEPVVDVVEVVAVVVVEVVWVASLSACVLLGGVISGVLWGATSAVLPPPPQAPNVMPPRSTAALARPAVRARAAAARPLPRGRCRTTVR